MSDTEADDAAVLMLLLGIIEDLMSEMDWVSTSSQARAEAEYLARIDAAVAGTHQRSSRSSRYPEAMPSVCPQCGLGWDAHLA